MRYFNAAHAVRDHHLRSRRGVGNVRTPNVEKDSPTPQADIDMATCRYDRRLFIGDYRPRRYSASRD